MEKIKSFLIELGFGKNEAEVYAALVSANKSLSVLEISKKSKLHRSNIYDALRTLVQEGLVFEIKGETKLYEGRPPRSLLNLLHRKVHEAESIIKDYESRTTPKKETELAKVSQGVFALREAVNSLIDTGEDIFVVGIPGSAPEIIGPMLEEFHEERIKKKIIMRHLYNSSASDRARELNKLPYTEARILPKKYDSNVTTNVVGDRVVIFLWGEQISVVEMVDKDIAKTYTDHFEILWNKSKKLPSEN